MYEEGARPLPGPGEVLLAVHAAGITPTELHWDATYTKPDGTSAQNLPSDQNSTLRTGGAPSTLRRSTARLENIR